MWDLCRPVSVRAAQRFLAGEARAASGKRADAALVLREAANCSSQARQTPLHAAAEAGDPAMVQVGPFQAQSSDLTCVCLPRLSLSHFLIVGVSRAPRVGLC